MMPTYKITDPTSGKAIKLTGDSPPSEAELSQIFAKLNGGKTAAPKSTPSAVLQEDINKMSGTQKFLAGVGGGMYETYKGLQQAGAAVGNKLGLVKDNTLKRITDEGQEAKNQLAILTAQSPAAAVGQFEGNLVSNIPTMMLPGGVSGGALKRAGTAALTGTAIGGSQFVPEGDSRLTNMLAGGTMGAGTSLMVSGAGKLLNTAAGNVQRTAVQRAADRYKIPVTLGESTGKVGTQKTEVLLERAPGVVGLGPFRVKQNEAAKDAAKNLLGKYIADPAAGDIEAGNRAFSSKMFEEVKDLVAKVPNQEIKPQETRAIARQLAERYPDIFKKLQDTQTEGIIADIVQGVKNVETPQSVSPILAGHPYSNSATEIITPASSTPRTLTFEEAWTLRQGLGDKIGQARALLSRGEIDKTAYSLLKQLFGAVSNDLDNWSASIGKPEIMQQFRAANDAYKNYVVKYDILQRAYDKAAGTVGAGEMFSPKKFSTALKAIVYKDKALKNFTAKEQAEMTGLANIMQVIKRAGQYAENPPTGNRWGAITVGGAIEAAAFKAGGLAGALKTAGVGALTAGTLKFLTTTTAGKNLVLAASRVEPTSPAMKKIVQQIMNQYPKLNASLGSRIPNESNNQQPADNQQQPE